jgi:hypothetical protein
MWIDRGNRNYSEKTCPNATLSTTIPHVLTRTLTRTATNRLSCGMAIMHLTQNYVTIVTFVYASRYAVRFYSEGDA